MKFAIISDVHVKNPNDPAEDLLINFLQNKTVQDCDGIFLLGDIFDLMIGPHSQYFARFNRYFSEIKKLLSQNKKIHYVEGNHDFHLRNLYRRFFEINKDLNPTNFKMNHEFVIQDGRKILYFSHGDEVEIDNKNYRRYKSIVTSRPLTYYANNLMPYFLITKIGERSSEISRKKNNKRYSTESDLTPVKEKFRKSAEIFHRKKPYDVIVCGHSHVKDYFLSEKGFEYVNNGYAQHTKTYIFIENGNVGFKDIIESDSSL